MINKGLREVIGDGTMSHSLKHLYRFLLDEINTIFTINRQMDKYMKNCFLLLLLSFIIAPIVTNIVCSIPCGLHAGNTSDWIAFFGSFFGSMFTVWCSLAVFRYTFKKEKAIREYEHRKKEYNTLVEDISNRITKLHLREFTEIVLDLKVGKGNKLTNEHEKLLLNYYYQILSDKNTFELKYGNSNSSNVQSFKKFYFEYIDNIIVIICYAIWQSENPKLEKALVYFSAINEENISKGFELATAWIIDEFSKNEQYKEKYGI